MKYLCKVVILLLTPCLALKIHVTHRVLEDFVEQEWKDAPLSAELEDAEEDQGVDEGIQEGQVPPSEHIEEAPQDIMSLPVQKISEAARYPPPRWEKLQLADSSAENSIEDSVASYTDLLVEEGIEAGVAWRRQQNFLDQMAIWAGIDSVGKEHLQCCWSAFTDLKSTSKKATFDFVLSPNLTLHGLPSVGCEFNDQSPNKAIFFYTSNTIQRHMALRLEMAALPTPRPTYAPAPLVGQPPRSITTATSKPRTIPVGQTSTTSDSQKIAGDPLDLTNAPTPPPTMAPTPPPTKSPVPTAAPPTPSPTTKDPTQSPTPGPTPTPTTILQAEFPKPGGGWTAEEMILHLKDDEYPVTKISTFSKPDVDGVCGPAPTASPTSAPTAAPTASPTNAPTAAPTSAPTSAPTAAPTAGAGWVEIGHQYDAANNLFESKDMSDFKTKQIGSVGGPRYMNVAQPQGPDGGPYKFKIEWWLRNNAAKAPNDDANRVIEWKQARWVTSTEALDTIAAANCISVTGNDESNPKDCAGGGTKFQGFATSPDGNCMMDGNGKGGSWWNCAGIKGTHGGGIPCYRNTICDSFRLSVWKSGVATAPNEAKAEEEAEAGVSGAYEEDNPDEDKREYSSFWDANHKVSKLGSTRAWVSKCKGRTIEDCPNEWAQLDLGSIKAVSAVVTQPRKDSDQRVTSYKVRVSTDGSTDGWSWVDSEATFTGNEDSGATDVKAYGTFSSPVNARYVQVWPLTWKWWNMAMRFGVMAGVKTEDSKLDGEQCYQYIHNEGCPQSGQINCHSDQQTLNPQDPILGCRNKCANDCYLSRDFGPFGFFMYRPELSAPYGWDCACYLRTKVGDSSWQNCQTNRGARGGGDIYEIIDGPEAAGCLPQRQR